MNFDEAAPGENAVRLLQALGYLGYVTVQLKLDPRDEQGKLLEVNCRPGFQAWRRRDGVERPAPVSASPAANTSTRYLRATAGPCS